MLLDWHWRETQIDREFGAHSLAMAIARQTPMPASGLNQEVFCGELSPSKEELGVLADVRVI